MVSAAKNKKFTYADYKALPDGVQREIIDGNAYDVFSATDDSPRSISAGIFAVFSEYFKKGPCRTFRAPCEVVFDYFNVVHPELLVVCNPQKIMKSNILGAPDLVVEILSPATRLKNKREKKNLYEKFGVREYLIFCPEYHIVEQYRLIDGRYAIDVRNWDEKLPLFAFPELGLKLWDLFGKELPKAGAE